MPFPTTHIVPPHVEEVHTYLMYVLCTPYGIQIHTYDTYHPYKCTNYSYHHPGPLPPFHFQTCLGNREFSDIIVVMSSITPTPQGKLSYVRMYLYVGLSTYIRHLYIRNKERTIHRGYMYCMYSTNTQRRWGVSYTNNLHQPRLSVVASVRCSALLFYCAGHE